MIYKLFAVGLAAALFLPAAAPDRGRLRAGAARIDITPAEDAALPMDGYGGRVAGHKGIHDRLYVRAVVVDDGERQAAILSCDLLFVEQELWERVAPRLSRETGIPRDSILMAATHTHSAPTVVGPIGSEFLERWKPWRARLEDNIVEAVRQAKANLQPARVGFGTGKAYVNTNRRAFMMAGGWGLGVNPEGPSDKTVGVVRFENASGEPIALLINYAVHGTSLGPENYEISADLPGAVEQFVEQHFNNKVVAAWTSAASGDQNPIYGPGKDYATGGPYGRMSAMGQLVAQEVVRVTGAIRTSPYGRIRGAQKTVTCPGQKLSDDSDPDSGKVTLLDDKPVEIRVSLLMVNHTALVGVSGEVLTLIGTRLKQESPFSHTLMVTHCNGTVGYIPDDSAYQHASYEVASSPVKQGCAETAIVNAALELMDQN
jgi:neutral ceramidase